MTDPKRPDKTPENRNLPITKEAADRLRSILDAKISVQSVVNGTGRALATVTRSATRGPMKALATYWRKPGNARTRADNWKEALRATTLREDRIFSRDGKLMLIGRNKRILVANAGLDGVSLARADLSSRSWHHVPFKKTDLTEADFRGAALKDNDFNGATLVNTLFAGATLNCPKFQGCNLRGADFRGATIKGYSDMLDGFRNADLSGADFTGAKFTYCIGGYSERVSMRGANLEGTKFSLNAKWDRLDLRGAKNADKAIIVDRRGNPIPGAKLLTTGGVIINDITPKADRRQLVAQGLSL